MWKKLSRQEWVGIISGAMFIFLLAFGLTRAISEKGMESAEAASWMQAIGSIGAIAAAIAISTHQHLKNVKAADDERALNKIIELKNILQLINGAEVRIRTALDAYSCGGNEEFDNYYKIHYIHGDLQDIAEAIGQIPVILRIEILGLTELKRTIISIEQFLNHLSKGQPTVTQYQSMVRRLEKDHRFVIEIRKDLSAKIVSEGTRVSDINRVTEMLKPIKDGKLQ